MYTSSPVEFPRVQLLFKCGPHFAGLFILPTMFSGTN